MERSPFTDSRKTRRVRYRRRWQQSNGSGHDLRGNWPRITVRRSMSYKVFLFDALSPVEWSQVAWKLEGQTVSTDDCRIEFIHDVLLANLPHDGMILDAGCG